MARTATTTAASSDTTTGRMTIALKTNAASRPKYSAASPTPTPRMVSARALSRPAALPDRRPPAMGLPPASARSARRPRPPPARRPRPRRRCRAAASPRPRRRTSARPAPARPPPGRRAGAGAGAARTSAIRRSSSGGAGDGRGVGRGRGLRRRRVQGLPVLLGQRPHRGVDAVGQRRQLAAQLPACRARRAAAGSGRVSHARPRGVDLVEQCGSRRAVRVDRRGPGVLLRHLRRQRRDPDGPGGRRFAGRCRGRQLGRGTARPPPAPRRPPGRRRAATPARAPSAPRAATGPSPPRPSCRRRHAAARPARYCSWPRRATTRASRASRTRSCASSSGLPPSRPSRSCWNRSSAASAGPAVPPLRALSAARSRYCCSPCAASRTARCSAWFTSATAPNAERSSPSQRLASGTPAVRISEVTSVRARRPRRRARSPSSTTVLPVAPSRSWQISSRRPSSSTTTAETSHGAPSHGL